MTRRFFGIALLVACSAVAWACNSPTLPLPPPAMPSIEPLAGGKVRLYSVGGAAPDAIIVVYNRNPQVPLENRVGGAQADARGTWQATVVAGPGDYLDITQEFDNEQSPPVTVVVPR